jgi:hypothetical protein
MADAEVGRQELPVESYIFQLSSVKLLTEEGQRSPTAAVTAVLPLLENCTDVVLLASMARLISASAPDLDV